MYGGRPHTDLGEWLPLMCGHNALNAPITNHEHTSFGGASCPLALKAHPAPRPFFLRISSPDVSGVDEELEGILGGCRRGCEPRLLLPLELPHSLLAVRRKPKLVKTNKTFKLRENYKDEDKKIKAYI